MDLRADVWWDEFIYLLTCLPYNTGIASQAVPVAVLLSSTTSPVVQCRIVLLSSTRRALE